MLLNPWLEPATAAHVDTMLGEVQATHRPKMRQYINIMTIITHYSWLTAYELHTSRFDANANAVPCLCRRADPPRAVLVGRGRGRPVYLADLLGYCLRIVEQINLSTFR